MPPFRERARNILKARRITKDERNKDLLNIKAYPETSLVRKLRIEPQISNFVPRCLISFDNS
jgi:hypothetical protein